MKRLRESMTEGRRSLRGEQTSRYVLFASLAVNLFLAAVVLGALQAPAGDSAEAAPAVVTSGTMELLVGHYMIQPVNDSYNSGGHPAYSMPASELEDDSIHFNWRLAQQVGAHPVRCLLIKTKMMISQVNPPVEWESIGCEDEKHTVFVEEGLLGEWYGAWLTGDRVTAFGPGYSAGVRAETPQVQNISGVFLATVGHTNETGSSVTRELIEYEGEIRWEYHPAISWSRWAAGIPKSVQP